MPWSPERRTVRGWRRDLDALSARIAPRFSRSDLGRRVNTYLEGLLGAARRKNSWQLAEDVGDESP